MSSRVSIGYIQIGGASNAVGVFSGQNMQNDWDSHAPNISTIGGVLGNRCLIACEMAYMWNSTAIGQPVFDQDTKLNTSPIYIGP